VRYGALSGIVLATVAGGVSASSCGAKTGLQAYDCVSFDALAERAELDVLIMLDTSGSMGFETAEGISKSRSMRDALADFLGDPESAGIGIGLSFFPILRPEVPDYCFTDAECGEPNACRLVGRACLPSNAAYCETDADCSGTGNALDVCVEYGACADDIQTLCVTDYDASLFCKPSVACLRLGGCLNQASCNAEQYASLVVDVAELPAARKSVLLALDTQVLLGGTPSLPALTGALDAARALQGQRGQRKAIVILATDGLPTVCDPAIDPDSTDASQGIDSLIQVAQSGASSGIATFVIGVFSPEEEQEARLNLGRIAQAGSTGDAFIVTTDQAVTTRLVETLNGIRRSARACEYSIPWPAGFSPDPSSLAVRLPTATGGEAQLVPRVDGAEQCQPGKHGFHFERAPEPGVLPARVVLCPTTCAAAAGADAIELVGNCRRSDVVR
jgi:hypothetical protein